MSSAPAIGYESASSLYVPEIPDDGSLLDAAVCYGAAGFYVGPMRVGKNPGSLLGKGWPSKTSVDAEVHVSWFAGAGEDTGIFLHCGRSGVVAFEIDRPDKVPDWMWPHLNTTPFQQSRANDTSEDADARRGHYVFRVPAGVMYGNSEGGFKEYGFGEIRGRNGVIVVQPSPHARAAKGGAYMWQRTGSVPLLPKELAELLKEQDPCGQVDFAATDEEVRKFLDDHDEWLEDNEARGRNLLEGALATASLDERRGASRHSTMNTLLAWLMDDAAASIYSAQEAYDAAWELWEKWWRTKRGGGERDAPNPGEFEGMAAWAVGQAMSKTDDQLQDRYDRVCDGTAEDEEEPATRRSSASAGDEQDDTGDATDNGWPAITPLVPEEDLRIPLDAIPAVVRDIVVGVAAQVESPVEVPLAFALGVLSAATRGSVGVCVNSSWEEACLAVWALTLVPSGERKSKAASTILKPLQKAEIELREDEEIVTAGEREEEIDLTRQLKEARREGDLTLAKDLAERIAELNIRELPQMLYSDVTVEALGQVMTKQRGPAAIFSAEAAAFATVAGAYSKNGRSSVSLLNQAYDCEYYSDARVTRDSTYIPRPFLAWGTAVQPEVLKGYASADTAGSGFLSRFLFMQPPTLVGKRTFDTTRVHPTVVDRWSKCVTALHEVSWERFVAMTEDAHDIGDPTQMTVTKKSQETIRSWNKSLEARKHEGGDLHDGLSGWAEKHPGRMIRVAALFTLADNPKAVVVKDEYVDAAIEIGEVLISHAMKAFKGLRADTETGHAQTVLDWILKKDIAEFTTREAWQRFRRMRWAKETDDVREVLHQLEDHGFIRGIGATQKPRGGRPSERWETSPRMWLGEVDEGGPRTPEGGPTSSGMYPKPPEPRSDRGSGGIGDMSHTPAQGDVGVVMGRGPLSTLLVTTKKTSTSSPSPSLPIGEGLVPNTPKTPDEDHGAITTEWAAARALMERGDD